MRRHLILFVRAPAYGSGKRRLARDIGDRAALGFERLMLARLLRRRGRRGGRSPVPAAGPGAGWGGRGSRPGCGAVRGRGRRAGGGGPAGGWAASPPPPGRGGGPGTPAGGGRWLAAITPSGARRARP